MGASAPKKAVLFSGIGFLILGIVLRKVSDYPSVGLILILTGVGLKTYYIIQAIRSGLYTPGVELWFLFVGLALFLTGLYLRGKEFFINPTYLIVLGISLKVLFIVRFIQIVRNNRQKNQAWFGSPSVDRSTSDACTSRTWGLSGKIVDSRVNDNCLAKNVPGLIFTTNAP